MTGLNKYEDKDKRRARRRNFIAKDLRKSEFKQQVIPDRRRKVAGDHEDEFFFEERYYDDTGED